MIHDDGIPDSVTLHPAHTWECPDCGWTNFETCVVVEHSEEGRDELEDAGLPTETGFWVTAPEEVACDGCGREFLATDSRDDDEED